MCHCTKCTNSCTTAVKLHKSNKHGGLEMLFPCLKLELISHTINRACLNTVESLLLGEYKRTQFWVLKPIIYWIVHVFIGENPKWEVSEIRNFPYFTSSSQCRVSYGHAKAPGGRTQQLWSVGLCSINVARTMFLFCFCTTDNIIYEWEKHCEAKSRRVTFSRQSRSEDG